MATYTAGSVRMEVIPDMSRFGAKLRAEARGLNETVKVGVDIDRSGLTRMQSELARVGRNQTVKVKADVDTSSLSKLSSLAMGAAGNVGMIGAAAAAAGAALAVLPAALSAAAGAGGVLFLSLKGVGEALQAYTKDQDAAGKKAAQSAQQQTASARSIRQAEEGVADARRQAARTAEQGSQQIAAASRRVADAVDEEKRAQEDVTRARKAAALAAEDLRSRVSHLALDQEQATIRVQEAQEAYDQVNRTAGATDRDRQKALLDLKQAQLDQADLTREAGRAQTELQGIEKNGIDSTDQVQSALRRQADASQNVKDAQASLAQTQRDVAQANQDAGRRITEALQGVKDAQISAAQSAAVAAQGQSEFADAMAKLTAPARELVNQLIAMKPLLDQLQQTAGQAFLPGLTQMLRDSTALFPIVNGFIGDVGRIMGDTARQFGQLFQSSEFQANLKATFEASLPLIKAFGDALLLITDAWFKLGAASGPATQGLADFVTLISGGLADFLTALQPAMSAFGDIWRSLGSVIGNLLTVLGPVVAALAQVLAPVLVALTPVINQIVTALGTWLGQAIIMLTPLLVTIAQVISDVLSSALTALMPVFQALFVAIQPMIPVLQDIAVQLGEFIVKAIQAVAPMLPPLIGAFLQLVQALLPVVPILIDFATQVIDALLPYLPDLTNILVTLITQAILPLIPPLLDIVKMLLPDFIETVKFLTPIIMWLAQVLTDILVWTVNNLVIPAIKFIKAIFEALGEAIRLTWVQVIKPAWDAVVSGLGWLKENFGKTVDTIKTIWEKLKGFLAKPINFMIDTVWNNGIRPAWNLVADLLPGVEPVGPLSRIPEFATGGKVSGGTPGKDSVLAKLMPDEYVLPVKMAEQMGYGNLDRIRKSILGGRRYQDEGFMSSLPGYEQGGRIAAAKKFAQGESGKPYQWAGVGNPSWDCSGFMSGIQNVLMGRNPRQRLYATAAFQGGRGAGGLQPGLNSAFTVGVEPNSHMAGTLDGVNVESSSSYGVRYGPPARGSTNPMFPYHFSLASAGGEFIDAGPGGGGLFDWIAQLLAKIAEKFSDPVKALINKIPFDAPPQFMGIPKKLMTDIVDKATEWFTSSAGDAGGGAGGTGPVADQVKAVAAAYGWDSGAQWNALSALINKESSWNPNAANPTSSARGLFQKMTSVNGPLESTVTGQAQWGLNYIKNRYGDPIRAWAFHQAHNWYDSGGWLPPGASMAMNGTGTPEAVLTSRQWDAVKMHVNRSMGESGTVINVYAQPGQSTEAVANAVKRRLDFASRTG